MRRGSIEAKMGNHNAKFCTTAFTAKDVCDAFDVTEREAKLFMLAHEQEVSDIMWNAGWLELIKLAKQSGLKARPSRRSS